MTLKLQKHSPGSEIAHHLKVSSNRLTPEMSNAIKRQRELSKMDYWKTGFSGIGLINTPGSLRRPFHQKLAHLHKEHVLPSAYIPNVIPTAYQPKIRERSKVTPTIVFSRSRTTLGPTHLSFSEKSTAGTPKTQSPDLTYMQIADRLWSHSQPVGSDLLTSSPTQNKEIDIPIQREEDMADTNNNVTLTNKDEPAFRQKYQKERRRNSLPALKFVAYNANDSNDNSEHVDAESSHTPTVFKSSSQKTSRPILKNVPNRNDQDFIMRALNNDINRSNITSENMTRQPRATEIVCPDLTVYPTTLSHKTRREDLTYRKLPEPVFSVMHTDMDINKRLRSDSRKRSVTFNSDHKIHEYVPHEPICS